MRLGWTPPARAALDGYLDYLWAERPALSAEARAEIEESVGRLARHPFIGRPARWPGLREWSLLRWRKIVVYRVDAEHVVIVAFYDARQDLRHVDPGESSK